MKTQNTNVINMSDYRDDPALLEGYEEWLDDQESKWLMEHMPELACMVRFQEEEIE